MRRNALLTFAALVLVLVSGFAALLPAQGTAQPTPSTWEYRVFLVTEVIDLQQKPDQMASALEARFNELGKDGWEIAENINGAIVFKRLKR